MMAYHAERDVGEDVPMQPEGEPSLDKMVQHVQNLSELKHLYDQIDYNSKQY